MDYIIVEIVKNLQIFLFITLVSHGPELQENESLNGQEQERDLKEKYENNTITLLAHLHGQSLKPTRSLTRSFILHDSIGATPILQV